MAGELAFCPYCGKPVVAGASFCAYCGKPLPKARDSVAGPDLHSRAIPVPPRDAMQGPCAVIYTGGKPLDIRRAGRIVAQVLAAPLPDVTRNIRTSRGFVATRVPGPRAIALAERLEKELGVKVLILPEADCLSLPPAMRMREVHMDTSGVRCQAYTWDETTELSVRWDEMFLVSCARLELERVSQVEEPVRQKTGNPFDRFVPVLETETRHEFLIDVVLHKPWRRLRLDFNTSAYALSESEPNPETLLASLQACAESLMNYGRSVPMNRGVRLLALNAPDSDWAEFTFANKADFEAYTRWLLHLVRYGHPIADGADGHP